MAIEITQEEAKVLSQFSYMNLNLGDYENKTLQEMATKLIKVRDEAMTNGDEVRGFGGWGGTTNKEQYDMLQAISDGNYSNLSNLQIKDYVNNEDSNDKFVAYAFKDINNPQNVISAFRGTMGTRVDQTSAMEELNGKLDHSWWNNYNQIFNDANPQYQLAEDFVRRNMVAGGDTLSVGHSQGGGDGLYTSAVIPGVRSIVFDAPGINNSLTSEQAARLVLQSENIASQIDFCSSSGSHPELRSWSQYFAYPQLDQYGEYIKDENGQVKNLEGISAGHYLQTLGFDPAGSHIAGERSEFSLAVEALSQKMYIENKAEGNRLGDDILLRQIVVLNDPEGVRQIIEQEKKIHPELAKELDERLVRIEAEAEKIQFAGKIMDDVFKLESGTSAATAVNSKLAYDGEVVFANTIKNHPDAKVAFEKILEIEGQKIMQPVLTVAETAGNWVNDNIVQPGIKDAETAGNWVIDNIVQPGIKDVETAGNWVNDNIVQPGINDVETAGNWVNDNIIQPGIKAVETWENTTDNSTPEQSAFDCSANFDRLIAIGDQVEQEFGLGIETAKQTMSQYFGIGR